MNSAEFQYHFAAAAVVAAVAAVVVVVVIVKNYLDFEAKFAKTFSNSDRCFL